MCAALRAASASAAGVQHQRLRCSAAVAPSASGATMLLRPAAGHHHRLTAPRHHHKTNGRRGVACRVLTESAVLEVGSPAPDFELPEPLTGKTVSLASVADGKRAALVMVLCNHCPYVVLLKPAITALAKEYQAKGVGVVAISANSTQTHPQDGPEKMAEDAVLQGYTFPYLFDETQAVAKAYKAACTPEFYVFGRGGGGSTDGPLQLVYHGQFDASRPKGDVAPTGKDLRVALDAALSDEGRLPDGFKVRLSIGCNIKWHPGPGNEPEYFASQVVKK